jgi:AcrR family transcriptional regulator
MQPARSRRELYSEATRAALLEEATALFAARGYAGTSLEDVATASQVTRGAVYHHFASKQALFEVVLEQRETQATAEVTRAAAAAANPRDAALLALDAFLDQCCDPVYGRLVWVEGPTALGWHRWRECEQKHSYGIVEKFVHDLIEAGYLTGQAADTQVKFTFWMLGGAGLALAEADAADRPRLRDEWRHLILRSFTAMLNPSQPPGAQAG